jgi:uncharacterized repeat protein (TIGR03847 family)
VSEIELGELDRFVVGTIGMPGERTFYLQAVSGRRVLSYRCEKGQVAALAEAFERMLKDLPLTPTAAAWTALELPLIEEWSVGTIGLAYEPDADRVILVLEELQRTTTPVDGKITLRLTREQVLGVIQHGRTLVSAGRPMCTYCGAPIDPDGYNCACLN